MRNLKRALSLALAAVMVIGMMVIGAGASYQDFTDKDEIKNSDAVATLVELGVIAGKQDGSYFDPAGIITRAEMAKLICVVYNGGKEPLLGTKDKPSYSDIKGTWAESYIEYCSTLGFVSGDGAGKFNPTATVTGSQAAKMLLTALGYKSDVEGYVGADWENNVNVKANQIGLYDDLSIMPSVGLTRDNAAQMVYNALNASMVKYDNAVVVNGVTIGNSQLNELGYTILQNKFGVYTFEGVVVSNEKGTLMGNATTLDDKGYTTVYGTGVVYNSTTGNYVTTDIGEMTFKVATSADLIGRHVTLYAKTLKTGVWQSVYGQPIVSSGNNVVTYTGGFTDQASFIRDLNSKGIKSVNAVTNSDGVGGVMNNFVKSADITTLPALYALLGNGIEVTIINNDENNTVADYVLVKKLGVAQVSVYNAKGNSGDGAYSFKDPTNNAAIPGMTNLKTDDVKGIEDVAKDDIVLYYLLDTTYYVQKAETITVTPNSTKGNNVTAGGTTYKGSALVAAYDEDANAPLSAAVSIGDDAKFYLDEHGYVVFAEAVTAAKQYIFVTGSDAKVNANFESLTIKGVLSDGTTVTKSVASIDGNDLDVYFGADTAATVNTKTANRIYTYTTNTDGALKLRTNNIDTVGNVAGHFDTIAAITVTKNVASLGSGIIANANTVFVLKNGSSYSVYTGISNVPTVTLGDISCVKNSDGVALAVFATGTVNLDGATGNEVYILNSNPSVTKNSNGDYTYTYDAVVNGVVTTIDSTETDAGHATDIIAGLYVRLSLSADNKFDPANVSAYAAAPATTGFNAGSRFDSVDVLNGSVITSNGYDGVAKDIFASPTTFTITGNTKVVFVDVSEKTARLGAADEIIYLAANDSRNAMTYVIGGSSTSNQYVAQTIYVLE